MSRASFLTVVLLATLATITTLAQARTQPSNKALQRELLRMAAEDQKYRGILEAEMIKMSATGNSAASTEYIEAVRRQNVIDARNAVKLEKIIKRYGWPGRRLVGDEAAKSAFLILQHANLAFQQKYLPLLKAAATNGDAQAADAAMLEDRVLVREGKKQMYGTQVGFGPDTGGKLVLSPIEDEEHVDERRAAVGLMPLAEYLKHFGLEYKPPPKKKQP